MALKSEADRQSYLDNKVKISKEERAKTADWVIESVKEILYRVNKKDARYSAEPIKLGNYGEYNKVDKPNEFNFMVPLSGILQERLPFSLEGSLQNELHITLNTVTPWNKSVPNELSPLMVMVQFQNIVADVLKDKAPSNVEACQLKPNCQVVTLTLKKLGQEVDVDLIPIIFNHFSQWLQKWPRVMWPSDSTVRTLKVLGIDVVNTNKWKLSFFKAEKRLRQTIDEDGGRRKDSLKILKYYLLEDSPTDFSAVISSYHLQTTLFWACEEHRSAQGWNTLNKSLNLLILKLMEFLKRWHLPHYFLPGVNLLDTRTNPTIRSCLFDRVRSLK
ncbi:protein mab-21-like 3 [Bombina bombina]|uniref:protein mab-21-like 3 n=1 Tax=Bombina bombina TaxID=8345 RepID=UPI00235AE436|nr:protein mab-21-like 3 [Bombina bombina]